MALAESEKFNIIRILGWPAATMIPGNMSYSKIISDKLDGFPEPAEELLRGLVTRIGNLDDKLAVAVGRAGVKRIDDIEFFGSDQGSPEKKVLRDERTRIIREIAALMDIAIGPGASSGMMGSVCL